MNCPSCSAALPSLSAPCPSCGRKGPAVVEGNLAPDLSRLIPARLEGARDIPGRKRREPTWRDEVRQRVDERRRQRLGNELPLFPELSALDVPLDGEEAADLPLTTTAADTADDVLDSSAPETESDEQGPRLVWSTPTSEAEAEAPPVANAWTLGGEEEPQEEAAPILEPTSRRTLPQLPERPSIADSGSAFASALLMSEDEEPEVVAAPLEHPAAWSDRLQAALFDLGVLASLWAVVVYFASRAAGSVGGLRPVWPALVGYLAFLGVLYAVYFTGTCGRTIGKIVCGLRVVDVAGCPPGYPKALARVVIGTIGIAAGMVALIPIFFDPARRALHDRLLRTRVVKY